MRKLANIVLNHLESIEPLGTAAGRRVQKIVELTQKHFESTSDKIESDINEGTKENTQITGLKSLKVGPFRGFAKPEIFDLDSKIVLIYGPNGSGKSSFCEAMEYGLLGSVEEAQRKRFRQTTDYLKNAYVDGFSSPVIEAIDDEDEVAYPLNANEEQFRFCFVEKNRIDNFSRIAAYPPTRQTELISTLFGMDTFNEFVRGFSSEMDSKYIDIEGEKKKQLEKKQQDLVKHKQIIDTNEVALKKLCEEEKLLAEKYQKDMSFSEFVRTLGDFENPGELQSLEKEIESPLPIATGLKINDLEDERRKLENAHSRFYSTEEELAKVSEKISFKKLYQTVLTLQESSLDRCPACNTPLSETYSNPFDLAKKELEILKHLDALEKERDEFKSEVVQTLIRIKGIFQKVCDRIESEKLLNQLQVYPDNNNIQLSWNWWLNLHEKNDEGQTAWGLFKEHILAFEKADITARVAEKERESKKSRLKYLRDLEKGLIGLQTKRENLEEGIKNAKAVITQFDEDNKELFEKVESEKDLVSQNLSIMNAYKSFVKFLNSYKESLPHKLVADLGEQVVELYNAFNRNDSSKDKLAKIKLPLASGERIQISFQIEPDKYFDALHILSEGHIRCVGLAILLAKNLKEKCPILIFDDPVNAIDDEHRESIRKTLFEDDFFKEKQIILTCHGEEFFKDIHNLLGSAKAKASYSYTFLPQEDENHIQVNFNTQPRNYVLLAQEHLAKQEIRDALMSSRRALEQLDIKIWEYFRKNGGGSISISLRKYDAPWELRQLTSKLRKEINKPRFEGPNKEIVVQWLDQILGIGDGSREWRYLNKGTHEEMDRTEFDRGTVRQIVEALAQIDALV